jgi:hypothetical protein
MALAGTAFVSAGSRVYLLAVCTLSPTVLYQTAVAAGLVEMGRFLPAQARGALVLAGHYEKIGCPLRKFIRVASFETELDATTIAPPRLERAVVRPHFGRRCRIDSGSSVHFLL